MTNQEFFYQLYKKTAASFQNELKIKVRDLMPTFPADDPMRLETIRFVRDGGKRLRTVLARLVTEFYGVSDGGATAALDTFHKFLLCHDDIMDRDRMRWGMPTVHAALERLIVKENEQEHFGNGLAIVSGDLIAAMAYRFVLESAVEDTVKVRLLKLMCHCTDEVAWGWYDQLLMDYEQMDSLKLSFDRIKNSVIWVTGKYTISFPLRFGYTLVKQQVPDRLEEIADDLGVLFQTGDDLIGIFGDSSKSGKSNFGDIVQGKKTIPMWFAYEMSDPDQRDRLVELVGKKDIHESEVEEVRTIMKVNGAYQRSIAFMEEYSKLITEKISPLEIPEDMKRFFIGFAEYLVRRES